MKRLQMSMFVLAVALVAVAQTPRKVVAFTFDDLPVSTIGQNAEPFYMAKAASITAQMLAVLKKHKVKATGFVNEMKVNTPGARDFYCGLLENWLGGGHTLGHHGYNHLALGEVTLEQYEDDFLRGDVVTPLLMKYHNLTERYYRYPYNDTGDTNEKKQAFLKFLAAHGYQVAPMTYENDDWLYTSLYDYALKHKDAALADKLKQEYMAESERNIAFIEKISEMDFHRQIAQIADLHVNQMNADMLDAVLTLFERKGYRFVTMQEALADPAYKTADLYVGSDGVSWLLRWQPALHIPVDHKDDPEPPAWVNDLYDKLDKAGQLE